MWGKVFSVFVCILHFTAGISQLCSNNSLLQELSCTTEILGHDRTDYDSCRMKVFPQNSHECGSMTFGPISRNTHIGGVTLKPYNIAVEQYEGLGSTFIVNHTVLNITFSNIKWTTMKFRFQDKYRDQKNHCSNIMISNKITLDDKSVLFYDCYWPKTDRSDGQSHMFDFEATAADGSVNRGQYYFKVPSADMLSPTTTEEQWKPFIYIEFFPTLMRLHVMPPPRRLNIPAFGIKVVSGIDKNNQEVKASASIMTNSTDEEVIYDYNFVGANGSFSFEVTPLHEKCMKSGIGCLTVVSPKIMISSDPQTLNICIASITALIVATLFLYYIVLRGIRRYCCQDGIGEAELAIMIPKPPKILVAYSPANRLHAECVHSFVRYLRSEYGFEIMYDGDISSTSHGDPYIWAEEAFRLATHIIYVVGPAEETNHYNIYDQPIISAHQNIDNLILSFVKASRALKTSKEIINVLFEHSDGEIPVETRFAKEFTLLKDWQKLISYLSKNLLPKRQIMRTEKGQCFLDDLLKAKKLLGEAKEKVTVHCDKMKSSEKKILL
ncbi:uncharacterized protein LOC124637274 [Helicoverpa zea]|uniref:uncharacterized protein LOC124637274 n=1 Tax=Helicoverpa zea TaxID=7113 RepID=UPI001F585FB3|nr:uncharacterized protein LOC124637274 [Helicoverpa zea]